VTLADAPGGPAPRPHRSQADLARDLLRGQSLQLRHLEPGIARRALTPPRASGRLEAEHQPELAGGQPRRGELRDPLAEEVAQRAAALDRPLLRDAGRGEVRLAHDFGVLRELPPP